MISCSRCNWQILQPPTHYKHCPRCHANIETSNYQEADFQYFDEKKEEIQSNIAERLLSMMKLDDRDFKIVYFRLLNPNVSLRSLSLSLNISFVAVHKRLKRMINRYPVFKELLKSNYKRTKRMAIKERLASKNKVKI